MRVVDKPKVFLVAAPQIRHEGMQAYLAEVGGMAWYDRTFLGGEDDLGANPPDAEALVEFMGRLCYKSWEPGLNKNVTRVREDRGEYMANLLSSGHGSVLEHAQFGFANRDVARFVYDEIVRHRVGVAISAQSGRYVRMDEIGFRTPGFLKDQTRHRMAALVRHVEAEYGLMVAEEGLGDPGVDFAWKKRVTSALRRIAPHGQAWDFGWSANVRTLRHVIEKRTDPHAEEEIRIWADQIGQVMADECPLLFGDYKRRVPLLAELNEPPAWVTRFGHV